MTYNFEAVDALVVGGGPAGLMAAEMLSNAGRRVILVEAKPSLARKFLMAGKSGLNLTKHQPLDSFLGAYDVAAPWLEPMLAAFGPTEVQDWARALGQEVFVGSSGRVFPVSMKASPLLRAWAVQLSDAGVTARTRWEWLGLTEDGGFVFETPTGQQTVKPRVAVLALGGASWARLGSNGLWAPKLIEAGVELAPFAPANMGIGRSWSSFMATHIGSPIKSIGLSAGGQSIRAECIISSKGLEGGGIYSLSQQLREGRALFFDFFPDMTEAQIAARLEGRPEKESQVNRLRKALRLEGARLALVQECARPLPKEPKALAKLLKMLPIAYDGPRPIDEAISTAGGVTHAAVTDELMLRALPGVFVAGEMLDWEAPTGGYLLTACLATGRWAGQAAARWP
jgi:uncharacterized flavoprotein (TIGR03862 family)